MECAKLTAFWIPHDLTQGQMNRCVALARASLTMMSRRGNVRHVISGDEAWFHCWDPYSRRRNHEWISTRNSDKRPKVVMHEQSISKTMLIIFFDRQGVILYVFVPNGIGINGPWYLNVMMQLRLQIRHRRRAQFRANTWGLLHDGTPTHHSRPVVRFLTQHRTNIIPHPAYSPDLNPPDYWLFTYLKSKVCGQHFRDVVQLQNEIDRLLAQIPAVQ